MSSPYLHRARRNAPSTIGRKQDSPHPRPQMERLTHSVIAISRKVANGDSTATAQNGIRGSSDCSNWDAPIDSPKPKVHRGCSFVARKSTPLMNIVPLEQPVSRNRASANTVSAGVRHEHSETVCDQHLRISGHAEAVVAEP